MSPSLPPQSQEYFPSTPKRLYILYMILVIKPILDTKYTML